MPNQKTGKSYYSEGSQELATETPLTVQRLEQRRKLTKNSSRLVIVLVGLPARGKSFVARKLSHYLNWSGCRCKIFNVGRYRREAYASLLATQHQDSTERNQKGACDANFFDSHNEEANQLREKVAELALQDMLRWLDDEDSDTEGDDSLAGDMGIGMRKESSASLSTAGIKHTYVANERIAIFDATNSTNKRRHWVLEQCTSPALRPGKPTGVVFVESLCDDQELLEENYRYKISSSPDFDGMPTEEALADLRARVKKYEDQYETITDDSMSYIKVFNLSTKLMVNHIYGRMSKELVPALMAWHIGTRPVFLCRPGQTSPGIPTDGEDYVARDKIDPSDPAFLDMSTTTKRKSLRGDSLGHNGKRFREALLDFCYDEAHSFMFKRSSVHDMMYTGTSISGLAKANSFDPQSFDVSRDPFPMRILTSTMPRAVDTVNWEEYNFSVNELSSLNPLDKGDFAGLELDEIQETHTEWFKKLEARPFSTRFPGGESYCDLMRRLTSVVIDVEQQVIPTLVVSHVSILQCLMSYFRNSPVEECMSLEVPMHTVIKFTPVRGGGWSESIHPLFEDDGSIAPAGMHASVSEVSAMTDHASPIWSDQQPLSRTNSLCKKRVE